MQQKAAEKHNLDMELKATPLAASHKIPMAKTAQPLQARSTNDMTLPLERLLQETSLKNTEKKSPQKITMDQIVPRRRQDS